MTPMCACGSTRLDYDGYWICSHCDHGGCEGGCAQCRTYNLTTGKRISS